MFKISLIPPRNLRPGDMIVTSKTRSGFPDSVEKVKEVEHYACSQRGTHINKHSCYAWSVLVEITE